MDLVFSVSIDACAPHAALCSEWIGIVASRAGRWTRGRTSGEDAEGVAVVDANFPPQQVAAGAHCAASICK